MSKSKRISSEQIALDIIKISHELGVPLNQLTYTHYKKAGMYSYNQLKAHGGFQAILKEQFDYLTSPELTLAYAKRVKASYIRRLEAKVSAQEYLVDKVVDAVNKGLAKNPIKVTRYHAPKSKLTDDKDREIVAVISDTHFGLDIVQKETGVNAYSWAIAGNRMAEYALRLRQMQRDTGATNLHICLGGDLAQGVVYTVDKGTHALVTQVLGSAHILCNFIEFCGAIFSKITVHCTPDNHMRQPSKRRDGLISQKWDSYATMLHIILAKHFKDSSRIRFNVPLTPYTLVNVFEYTYFLTHGDSVLDIPYPTKILPINKINDEKTKLITSGISPRIDGIIIGHLHTPISMPLNTGGHLIINGTASGTDNYALAKGYIYNNPTQIAFVVNKHRGIESTSIISLGDIKTAKATLDSVIPTFKATIMGPEALVL